MFCNNCGKEIGQNVSFCPSCGASVRTSDNNMNVSNNVSVNNAVPVSNMNNTTNMNNMNNMNNVNNSNQVPVNNMGNMNNLNNTIYSNSIPVNNLNNYNNVPNTNNNVNTNSNANNANKSKKPIIICLIAVIVLMLVIIGILLLGKNGKDKVVTNARTIMIYLCGSDLESNLGLASYDISAIDPSKIDLDELNVVIYTGGAKTWHNDYIENDENAIYVLEEDGFVKKETYKKSSMGNASSLQTLLDYSYENYRADKYDLIMWNHGLGSLGISSDELHFGDYLNLNEVTEALKKSNFDGENKIETVVFRSCLNSTLEMASVFVPYANYFVASEEITWGGVGSDLLGFINDVTLDDSGVDFGKKFITAYEGTLNNLAKMYNTTLNNAFPVSTYAVIDLSKVDELINKLNLLFNSFNLDVNYNAIAKIRSNLYQYGTPADSSDYDTVDLYSLVSELKILSSSQASSLLTVLDEVIVYNWSNNNQSNGLAIYFPFNSSSDVRQMHYSGYKNLTGLSDYYEFIQNFDDYQASASGGGFSVVGKDEIKLSVANKKATLEISNTDVDEFAKASYTIFTKNTDGTYTPVYVSDTFELAKNTYTVDLNVNLIKVINNENNSSALLTIYENAFGNASSKAELIGTNVHNGNVYFSTDSKVSISKILMTSEDGPKGMFLNVGDYDSINFIRKNHSLMNNNTFVDNWETVYTDNNFQVSDYSFASVAVDSNCYVMFKIYDVDNLHVYSDLVQVK